MSCNILKIGLLQYYIKLRRLKNIYCPNLWTIVLAMVINGKATILFNYCGHNLSKFKFVRTVYWKMIICVTYGMSTRWPEYTRRFAM